jgi:hypothetical protein
MLSCLRPALKRKRSSFEESGGDAPAGTPGAGPGTTAGAAAAATLTPSSFTLTPSSSGKKAVKFPRGKKVEEVVGSADRDVDRTPIELPFTCDGGAAQLFNSVHP